VSAAGAQRFNAELEELQLAPVSAASPLHQAIAVGDVRGGRRGDVTPDALVRDDQLHDYIETVLSAREMLATEDPDYQLDAQIIRIGHPPFAMNKVEVTANIQYVLTERASGDVVFSTTVSESYTMGVADSMVFATRQALGAVASMTKNINTFTNELEAAFPVPADVGDADSGARS
jgi:hypothetical protein